VTSPSDRHSPVAEFKLIVLTGGPGAGKTALLESAKKIFCKHVETLPEAAGIIFGGGFWRRDGIIARKAAQRAIFHVQRELETIVLGESQAAIGLCDRGSLDSLAYWPADETDFFEAFQTTRDLEYKRYTTVIHLRTPAEANGYNHQNIMRIESAQEARRIDDKIAAIWGQHPGYIEIASTKNFIDKLFTALELIRRELGDCCTKQTPDNLTSL
jgi:hypothetical protein